MLSPTFRTRPFVLHRIDKLELMDEAGIDPATLAGNLADLRRVNRWLGGVSLTFDGLRQLIADLPPGSQLTILDVATGIGDIPEAVAAWANRRGCQTRIVATDINAEILAMARQEHADFELAVADAGQLPFSNGAFDIVMCSLVLHHLQPNDAVSMLSEMGRVARCGIVVNDLTRSWPGLFGAWLLSRLVTRNPMTRNDAPLSVRRAYTIPEVRMLAKRAGLAPIAFTTILGYRFAMTARCA